MRWTGRARRFNASFLLHWSILVLLAIPQFFDSVDTVRAVHDYLDAARVP
jgi:hypothetical protein